MTTSTDAVPSLLEPTPMKEGQFGDKEPEFRMDAYYYGFAPTGLLVIDRILSAVACAGKSFHHTDYWTDQCTPYDHLRGETVTDWIQNAANDAADAIRRAPASEVQAEAVPVGSFTRLVAFHAEQLDSNPYCYFELAYTRQTDWMAWITDRPAQGEPGTAAYAKSRKVIVRGQGSTAQEACADALAALEASSAGDMEVGS